MTANTKPWQLGMRDVLREIAAERHRQVDRYGHNEDIEDGTGPDVAWLTPFNTAPAEQIEAGFRSFYEDFEVDTGKPTWTLLVREELAEAFVETDPQRLEEELIQVAALCVSWVEKLRQRR